MTFTLDFDALETKRSALVKRMLWAVLLAFAIALPIHFFIDLLRPSTAGKQYIFSLLSDSAVWAAGWAILFTGSSFLFRNRRERERYVLIVDDDDEMRMTLDRSTLNFFFLHLKFQVRRDQIRAIYENKRGLVVSKYSRFGTFFLGAVWIPKKLPEYEFIKNLVLNWQSESNAGTRTPSSS